MELLQSCTKPSIYGMVIHDLQKQIAHIQYKFHKYIFK